MTSQKFFHRLLAGLLVLISVLIIYVIHLLVGAVAKEELLAVVWLLEDADDFQYYLEELDAGLPVLELAEENLVSAEFCVLLDIEVIKLQLEEALWCFVWISSGNFDVDLIFVASERSWRSLN